MNADMFNSYTKEATSLTTKLQKPPPHQTNPSGRSDCSVPVPELIVEKQRAPGGAGGTSLCEKPPN